MREQQQAEALLGGYRVLDLSDQKGVLCGRLFADMGADVIKIEPPGGDPMRRIGPFYKDMPDPEKSLYWFIMNANKRSITLDIEKSDGQGIFKRLVKTADFVIECFEPGYMGKLGLGYEELEKLNPRIIVASITNFGQTGPYAHWKAYDIVTNGMGGLSWLCGDQDRPPVRFTTQASYFESSVQAAAGTMIAHYWREMTGEGQHVDVSMQEAISYTLDTAPQGWHLEKQVFIRAGGGRYYPPMNCIYPCKDGYMARWTPEDMPTFIKWMEEVVGIDPDKKKQFLQVWEEAAQKGMSWLTFAGADRVNEFKDGTSSLFLALTKKELHEGAKARHFGWGPVNTIKDILETGQMKSREWLLKVEHPELGEVLTYPGVPFKLSEASLKIWRRAPLLGEHNREVYEAELGLSREELILLRQAGVI